MLAKILSVFPRPLPGMGINHVSFTFHSYVLVSVYESIKRPEGPMFRRFKKCRLSVKKM